MTGPTDLVFLREPQRRQILATVTGTRGAAFLLDRTLYCPASVAYRHPQPADRGEVWLGGEKRVLVRVAWQRGELHHAVRGTTPVRGSSANCHLDGDRRDDASSAHTAMHLVVSQFARQRLGAITAPLYVQGGRQFVLTARWKSWSPALLKQLLDAANDQAARRLEVSTEFQPRDLMRSVDEQPFEDGVAFPGQDPVVRIVRIGDASALPCDGTHAARTAAIGRIVATHVTPGRAVRVQFRVQDIAQD